MRTMGLDLGKKTIGVAISDESGTIAQPLKTIKRSSLNEDLDEIARLASEYSVKEIVLGLPVGMDGTLGAQSHFVLKFAHALKEALPLPVVTWDERMSTMAVTRVLIDADVTRAKRKTVVDKLAASYILQGYLDSKKAST